jgi:hypothetical protein
MELRAERQKAQAELDKCLQARERLNADIQKLRGRVEALDFLIRQEDDPDAVGDFKPAPPTSPRSSMANLMLGLFEAHNNKPLHTADLIKELRASGRELGPHPEASVASTANRLAREKGLKKVIKEGYTAWVKTS